MTRRIVVITAGVSTPSSTRLLADRLAGAVTTQVGARGESARVDVIDLRDMAVALATTLTQGGMPTGEVAHARELIARADAVIAVTPVFAAGYSGLFKMFIDTLDPDALTGVPVLIAATAGTPRHSLVLDHALRPLFTYLRAVVVPTGVFAATEDFGGDELGARVTRAAAELASLVVAEKGSVGGFGPDHAAPRRSGLDVPEEVTPFTTLLAGHTG